MAAAPTGILVMAHGGDPAWDARVDAALAELRTRAPVALAFGMADRRTLQAGIDSLRSRGAERVAVVRMFLSGDSFRDQTLYLLGLSSRPPAVFLHHGGHGGHGPSSDTPPPPVALGGTRVATHPDGLMDWPGVGPILVERARAAGAEPGGGGVVIIGHGMGDEAENGAVLDRMEAAADSLRQAGLGPVSVETLREDWPEARAAAEARIRERVAAASHTGIPVVLPFRLTGFGPYADVLDGLEYRPGEGLLPHPSVARWIEERATAVACDRGWAPPLASHPCIPVDAARGSSHAHRIGPVGRP
ncbi:MAG: hypothetical protein RLN75_04675 [Longimicrobiales bacterium]